VNDSKKRSKTNVYFHAWNEDNTPKARKQRALSVLSFENQREQAETVKRTAPTFSGEDRRVPRPSISRAEVCPDRPRAQTSAKNTQNGTSTTPGGGGQIELTGDRETCTAPQEPPMQQTDRRHRPLLPPPGKGRKGDD
jgi:hypothetical protein